jgi:hypothetical protein
MINTRPSLIIERVAVSVILISNLLVILPSTACSNRLQNQANTRKTENMKFMFEDNEEEKDAQKKLLERFPLGSDISKFASTMKSMKVVKCIESETEMSCEYIIPTTEAATYRWYISASSNQGKITEIYVKKYFTPYYPQPK